MLEASFYLRKMDKMHQKYPMLKREHIFKYKYLLPTNQQIQYLYSENNLTVEKVGLEFALKTAQITSCVIYKNNSTIPVKRRFLQFSRPQQNPKTMMLYAKLEAIVSCNYLDQQLIIETERHNVL